MPNAPGAGLHTATILAASDIPAAPVLGLMALGVVMALVGHIFADRRVVAVGVALVFLATLAMVIFAFAAYQGDESDPRPNTSPYGVPTGAVPGAGPAFAAVPALSPRT